MPEVDYSVSIEDLEMLGDELAAEFGRGNYEDVCARILNLPTPEASAMTAHVVMRLLGFQHSTAKALRDCLMRRAVS